MKKRITMPATLVCLFFLIFGSIGTLHAQQMQKTAVIPAFTISNSDDLKTPLTLLEGTSAYQATRQEMQVNYPGALPDQNNTANATYVFKFRYLQLVQDHLEKGGTTAFAIYSGYSDLLALTTDVWPGLVNESWREDMIILLSN